MSQIAIYSTGNCNFNYIDYLSSFDANDMVGAMKDLLTQPVCAYPAPKVPPRPVYRGPTGGMFLFAQSSEHKTKDRPYGPNFKYLIENAGLGKVIEIEPVSNPLHNNKKGILYVWIMDHIACANWWRTNVLTPWEKANEK